MNLSATLRHALALTALLMALSPARAQEAQIVVDTPPAAPWESRISRLSEAQKINLDNKANALAEQMNKKISLLDQINWAVSLKQNLKLSDGFGLRVGYKYTVEPSYLGSHYLRRDTYNTSLAVGLGDIFDHNGLFFRIEPGLLVDFVQFYPTAKEARQISNGYLPKRLPLNAEDAIKDLKEGDYAIASAFFNISLGYAGNLTPLDSVGVELSATQNLKGSYKVYVFRAEKNKVRIRLLANRAIATTVQGEIGWEPQIFGVSIVDRFLHKITNLANIIEGQKDFKDSSAVFMGDFTLDLNNEDARLAYNEMFEESRRLAVLKTVLNPLRSNTEIHEKMIQLIEPLNKVYRDDETNIKDPELRRVDRNFQGSTFAKNGSMQKFAAGLYGIWRGKKVSSHPHYDITRLGNTEDREHFSVSTATSEAEFSAGISRYKEKTRMNRILVNVADDKYTPTKLRGLGFYTDYTDKRFYEDEGEAFIDKLRKVIPTTELEDLIKKMDAENWHTFKGMRRNVRVSGRLFLKEYALLKYYGTSESAIKEKLLSHMNALKAQGIMMKSKGMVKDISGRCPARQVASPKSVAPVNIQTMSTDVRKFYCRDVAWISKYLSKILDRDATPQEREIAFGDLGKSPLFTEIGLGFMLNGLTLEELATAMYFDVKIFSDLSEVPFYYQHGTLADLELYDSIVEVMNFMVEENPDMRLFGTTDSLTTRRSND